MNDWGEEDDREHEAAMQAAKDEAQAEIDRLNTALDQKLTILRRDQETCRLGRRIYHEAPDDVLELIVTKFSDMKGSVADRKGMGGMNVLRLVSKRMKQVVESCATMLTSTQEDGPDSLPLDLLDRCGRIVRIRCDSCNITSLDGCPNQLKSLHFPNGYHIQSLEPLRECAKLEELTTSPGSQVSDLDTLTKCNRLTYLDLNGSRIVDISAVSLMPLLRSLQIGKLQGRPSVKDLSPLCHCKEIQILSIFGNTELKDLSLLNNLPNLRDLAIERTPVEDLTPLAALPNLSRLFCHGIPTTTSLLPLERCEKLLKIACDSDAKDLALLQERRPCLWFEIWQVHAQLPQAQLALANGEEG